MLPAYLRHVSCSYLVLSCCNSTRLWWATARAMCAQCVGEPWVRLARLDGIFSSTPRTASPTVAHASQTPTTLTGSSHLFCSSGLKSFMHIDSNSLKEDVYRCVHWDLIAKYRETLLWPRGFRLLFFSHLITLSIIKQLSRVKNVTSAASAVIKKITDKQIIIFQPFL